jgi:hypothetical protein
MKAMKASKKVFISYAPPDRNFAQELATQLSQEGLDVWLDAAELVPGDNYALAIGKALEQSDAMVVLLSPYSVASDLVRQEIEYALGSQKYKDRLIPVLIRPTERIPWILSKLLRLDLTQSNLDQVSRSIVNQLHGTAA